MKHVQVQVPQTEVVIPRACIESVALTAASECHYVDGETKMHCTGLKLEKFKGCEIRQVVKSKTEKETK